VSEPVLHLSGNHALLVIAERADLSAIALPVRVVPELLFAHALSFDPIQSYKSWVSVVSEPGPHLSGTHALLVIAETADLSAIALPVRVVPESLFAHALSFDPVQCEF